MKKHHLILIILVVNLLISIVFLSAWLGFELYQDKREILYLMLFLSFFMPIVTIASFVLLHDHFDRREKAGWIFNILLTGPLGCFLFYFKHKDSIDLITESINKKMRSGPDSLSEFNPRPNR